MLSEQQLRAKFLLGISMGLRDLHRHPSAGSNCMKLLPRGKRIIAGTRLAAVRAQHSNEPCFFNSVRKEWLHKGRGEPQSDPQPRIPQREIRRDPSVLDLFVFGNSGSIPSRVHGRGSNPGYFRGG